MMVPKRKRPEEIDVKRIEGVARRLMRASAAYAECDSVTFKGRQLSILLEGLGFALDNSINNSVEAGEGGVK